MQCKDSDNEDVMDTSENASAQTSSQYLIHAVAHHVFRETLQDMDIPHSTSGTCQSPQAFKTIWKSITNYLRKEAAVAKSSSSWSPSYRLGPTCVHFNRKKCVGTFDFKDNDLEICSKDNFSTIYADTCVCKGKWQYELMLGSKGVMQVGWATMNCEFSQENGVGDTSDSYAYDGNRQRKWNEATHKYGEMWHCGDIITCTIDLDKGEIGYLRNGRHLGVAFNNVETGFGMAYFPALSLAIDESLLANFGETPFCYPQEGFQPLQPPPVEPVVIGKKCLFWLNRTVSLSTDWTQYADLMAIEKERRESRKIALMVVAQRIGDNLAPLLTNPYIIEDALLPILQFLVDNVHKNGSSADSTSATQHSHAFFRFLMAILQEEEQKKVLNTLVMCLQRRYRQIAQNIDYERQKSSLRLLHLILSEPSVRKFCLRNVLIEKESYFRFTSFVCIKCVDKVCFKSFANLNFWSSKNGQFSCGEKDHFYQTVTRVEEAVRELEDLQIGVLKLLFTFDDAASYNDTSRAIFLAKFRKFIAEHLVGSRLEPLKVLIALAPLNMISLALDPAPAPPKPPGSGSTALGCRVQQSNKVTMLVTYNPAAELTVVPFIPCAVILSVFHACFLLFVRLWREEVEEELGEESVPPSMFFDGKLDYLDVQRLGGLESHLRKKFSAEREEALKKPTQVGQLLNPMDCGTPCGPSSLTSLDNCKPSTSGSVLGELLVTEVESVNEGLKRVNMATMIDSDLQQKRSKEELRSSLLHLLNGVVLLYHHGGHKQVEKIVAQSDVYFDNVSYLEELVKKMEKVNVKPELSSSMVSSELKRSTSVLQSKLKDQSYQHAWNLATILSIANITRIQLLLRLVLGALKQSSKMGGLFTFVPDFYVETLTQLCQDLRHLILCNNEETEPDEELKLYQPGGVPLSDSMAKEYRSLIMSVGEFLAVHFCDGRIVYADIKDSLIQALAGFVCHRPSLAALENMPLQSRLEMMKSLLQPYENRAWAQNNWILVRFWKGKGYGFRFTKSPHLTDKLGPKPAHCDIPNVILSSAPFYSEVFLSHVSETLQKEDISTPFLNSLLNQLNWVFSEFIGMLQEIQNASNRPERVFIDSRQLRICATCFDLALALLRVLEMIVSVSPNIFLDSSRPDSKPLLTRLCQLLCQVLNRVSVGSGCFSHVVNLEIPGLETIHYFPILTAVVGIICELLREDISKSKDQIGDHSATKTLLGEASFQMNSLYPLLGGKAALRPAALHRDASSSTSADVPPVSLDPFFVSLESELKQPKFCLRKYPSDISPSEIEKVVRVIHHLEAASTQEKQLATVEDADALCTICYASPSDAIFSPCGHSSCTTCIIHYLMNRSSCFFCKVSISQVKDSTGKSIFSTS